MDLTVISTYRCNSKCQMCYIWQNPSHPDGEITAATLAKLPAGFDNLNVSGGEPTLRNDLADLIDAVHLKARIIEISSNGLRWERLIPIIKRYPKTKIRFSLEGSELTSNSIRGEKDGFQTKVKGLAELRKAGGRDLGFAMVIQDENASELVAMYEMARDQGFELATSALHNAWQFHKNDNYFYNRLKVSGDVADLVTRMLSSNSIKDWFRAYLNLGLIRKVLGQDRLIPCTAATDFVFLDPWSDVWACNVRTDLKLGNLEAQTWNEIMTGEAMSAARQKVAVCAQNCWMVTTARTAMRSSLLPMAPKWGPLFWVVKNKIKLLLGLTIDFRDYINYDAIAQSPNVPRKSFLGVAIKPTLQDKQDPHYVLRDFENR